MDGLSAFANEDIFFLWMFFALLCTTQLLRQLLFDYTHTLVGAWMDGRLAW